MVTRRELGERGMSGAIDRLRLTTGELFDVPFTEAMFWITSLKELHQPKIDFASDDGKRLKALGWARNYAAHDLLILSKRDFSSSGLLGAGVMGMMMLGAPGKVVWVNDSQLPVRKGEFGRRNLYSIYLAGRIVLEPLEAAASYLQSLH
jgi:hypothetical protein